MDVPDPSTLSAPRRPRRPGPTEPVRGVAAATAALLVLAATIALGAPARAATTCATTATDGGSAQVCLTVASTATGTVPVTAAVTSSGSSPSKVEFFLGGVHLITDYSAPFAFSLHSQDFADAATTISAAATLRDGTVTDPAVQPITLQNGNSSTPVNTRSFTKPTATAPTDSAPLVLAAVGDGAGGEPAATSVTDMIASWNPNLVTYLGDVYQKGTLTEFKNWYGDGTTWYSRFRSITAPVIGNHEYEPGPTGQQQADGYFGYWDNPDHRYSYDVGGWHFVVLDSTSQYNQVTPGSDQYKWLAADLAANAGRCTVVSYHHPFKNIGPELPSTRLDKIWQLMRQNNVTLVLNGHDHNYQRWSALDATGTVADPQGVTELVVGGGGHGLQNFVASDPLVQASAVSFGAARIELRPDRADISYRTPDGGSGKQLDTAIIPCKGLGPDTDAPTAPSGVSATPDSTPSAAWTAKVSWSPSTDDRSVAQYKVYRDGVDVATVPATALSWHDGNLVYSTQYTYQVTAVDAAGNESPRSASAQVTTGPPAASATVSTAPVADTYVSQASPGSRYGTATRLRAANASGANMVTYLKFQVSGSYANVSRVKLRLWATAKSTAGFTVHATGTGWDDGSKTAPTWSTAPAVGTQLASGGAYNSGTWVEVDLTGSRAVTGDGTYAFALRSLQSTQLNWAGREDGAATAPQLEVTSSPPPDTTPPSVPQQVAVTSTSETEADLSWAASSDNIGVGSYRIARNGTALDTVPGSATTYRDLTVQPGTQYRYTVTAVDAAGNASAPSAAVSVVPPDLTAPEMDSLVAVLDDATTARLTWSAASDNVATTGYSVRRDGVVVATLPPTATTWVDSGLAAQTTHTYGVRAFDAAGNSSEELESSVTTPSAGGGSAPTVPADLTATVLDETTIRLSWSASTDDTAVVAYEVYRDGVSVAVTSGSTTTFTDSGLTPATGYGYRVRAGDGDGNWSELSTAVSATTAARDTTPPTTPTNLSGTGLTPSSIALTWAAAGDDRAVTGYGVYRDGTRVGEVDGATTSFADTGLAVGSTHGYTVDAVDAAGNRSAQSQAVSVRTVLPPDVTSSFTATEDTYVSSASPTSKYGSATSLRINGSSSSEMHTYLRFTPSGLLPTVKAARLTITGTSRITALTVRTVSGTWTESTVTWATRPSGYGAVGVDSPGVSSAGPLTIDVTPLVTNGDPISLVVTTTVTSQSAFSSREASPATVRPTLAITSGY